MDCKGYTQPFLESNEELCIDSDVFTLFIIYAKVYTYNNIYICHVREEANIRKLKTLSLNKKVINLLIYMKCDLLLISQSGEID